MELSECMDRVTCENRVVMTPAGPVFAPPQVPYGSAPWLCRDGLWCPRLGMDFRTDEERARDAAMPPPVITTNTPKGGQTYWWDIRQPPSAAEQCRELVERFEREYPDDAAMLNDLRALTDLLDECAANEYADLPQPSTWTSTGTGVQYYNPDPAATMNLVSIHEGGGGIESFGFGFTIAMVIVAVLAVLLQ